MDERTHLHVVPPASLVCRQCPSLVAPFDDGDLCERCRLYIEVDRITGRWSPEHRLALVSFVGVVASMLPPDEAGELLDLLSELVRAEH